MTAATPAGPYPRPPSLFFVLRSSLPPGPVCWRSSTNLWRELDGAAAFFCWEPVAGAPVAALPSEVCAASMVLPEQVDCPTQTTSQPAGLCPCIPYVPISSFPLGPVSSRCHAKLCCRVNRAGYSPNLDWGAHEVALVQSSLCPICWQASTLLLLASGV